MLVICVVKVNYAGYFYICIEKQCKAQHAHSICFVEHSN